MIYGSDKGFHKNKKVLWNDQLHISAFKLFWKKMDPKVSIIILIELIINQLLYKVNNRYILLSLLFIFL